MWYFVRVNGRHVTSPAYGKFELSAERTSNVYLWNTEQSAKNDLRWQHLIGSGDLVEYRRTYRH